MAPNKLIPGSQKKKTWYQTMFGIKIFPKIVPPRIPIGTTIKIPNSNSRKGILRSFNLIKDKTITVIIPINMKTG
jgi:hypothetical protein